ncbi:MAG: protein SCO1/2 [Halieaceae bacterium]|jgi:protein SCO1/2
MSPDATQKGIRRTVIGMVLLIVFVIASFVYKVDQPRVLRAEELKLNGAYVFDQPRQLKPFELVDHLGNPFNQVSLEGEWSLVFFGFTHCPDVCPTTMALLNELKVLLDDSGDAETRVIMVTVDPARDTVAKLAEYVPYFNEDFLGVTGNYLDIHRLATGLNTPFRKVILDDGSDYTMDHGAGIALINPRGHYHGFFKPPHELGKLRLTYRSIRASY